MVVQTNDGRVLSGSLVSMTPSELTLQVGVHIITLATNTIQQLTSGTLGSAEASATASPPPAPSLRSEPAQGRPPASAHPAPTQQGPGSFRLLLLDRRGDPIPEAALADFQKPLFVAHEHMLMPALSIPSFVDTMDRAWLTRRWMDNMRRESVRKTIGLAILSSGAGVLLGGLGSLVVHAISGEEEPPLIIASAALAWSSLPAFILGATVHLEGQIRFRQMQQTEINLLVSPTEAGALIDTHNAGLNSP